MDAADNSEAIKFFVYALCEPDGKTIRYIGLSANLWKRLRAHYKRSNSPELREWIFSLRGRGMFPAMIVLREVVGIEAGLVAENDEIEKHYALLGDSLLNLRGTGKQIKKTEAKPIVYAGRSMTIKAWARELGISEQALRVRLENHSPEVALSSGNSQGTPLDNTKRLTPPAYRPRGVAEVVVSSVASVSLTREQKRERRRELANAFKTGERKEVIAVRFDLSVATVELAVREFYPELVRKPLSRKRVKSA